MSRTESDREWIAEQIKHAPPITPEQRRRLSLILWAGAR